MNSITSKGREICFTTATIAGDRRWSIEFDQAGIPQIHECWGTQLEKLVFWCCERADNATVIVKPIP